MKTKNCSENSKSKTQKYKEDNKKKQHIITPKRKNNKKGGGYFTELFLNILPDTTEKGLKLKIKKLEEKIISLLEKKQHNNEPILEAKKIDMEIESINYKLKDKQYQLETIQENNMLKRDYNRINKEFNEFKYELNWIKKRVDNTVDLLNKNMFDNIFKKCYDNYTKSLYDIFAELDQLDIAKYQSFPFGRFPTAKNYIFQISELEKNIDALFMKFYPKQNLKKIDELKNDRTNKKNDDIDKLKNYDATQEQYKKEELLEMAFYNVLDGREIVKKLQYYITFEKILLSNKGNNQVLFARKLEIDEKIRHPRDYDDIPRLNEINDYRPDDKNKISIIRLKIKATILLEELEELYDNFNSHMNNTNPNDMLVDIYEKIFVKKEELMKILENIDDMWVEKPCMSYELFSDLLNEFRYFTISLEKCIIKNTPPCTFQLYSSGYLQDMTIEDLKEYENKKILAMKNKCELLSPVSGGASKVVVKKTLNPYNKYVAKQFPSMKKKFPNEKASEIMKKIAIEWNKTKNK
jgi:hypothetical protein